LKVWAGPFFVIIMKVAMFTDTFLPSTNGVVSSICNLVKGFNKYKIESIIFAPGDKDKVDYYEGAKVYFFKAKKFIFYPDFLLADFRNIFYKIETLIEFENPDIVIIEDLLIIGLLGTYFSKKFNKKIVGIYHTHYEDYSPHLSKGRFTKLMKFLVGKTGMRIVKYLHNSFDITISPSEEMGEYLKSKGFKNVVVIPNGIDFDKLKKFKRINIRKKYNILANKKLLVYVGRISFEKNINLLIDGMRFLGEDYILILVGKGPELEKLKDYSEKLGVSSNVIFTGYVPDEELGNYYESADLFVSASASETQGMTFAEAAVFGTPSVGVNRLGASSMIKEGYNGYKFSPGNVLDYVSKVKLFFSDTKQRRIMEKNSLVFSRQFDKNEIAKSMIKIFEEIEFKVKPSSSRIKTILKKIFGKSKFHL